MPHSEKFSELLRVLENLERVLYERIKNPLGPDDEQKYVNCRRQLIQHSEAQKRLPDFVTTSPNLAAIWGFLRTYKTWQERRAFILNELEPLRAWLEGREKNPEDDSSFPDPKVLLHTLRGLLEASGYQDIAALLIGVNCSFSVSARNQNGTLRVLVPLDRLNEFDAAVIFRILEAGRRCMPSRIYLENVKVDPLPESPLDENEPLPSPTWKSERLINHDGLWFRSKTEIRIYEALKNRSVFFFVNATGVLGGKSSPGNRSVLREPDFLVCLDGNWGILEVMGEQYHTTHTAPKDHDRARLFKEYGVRIIEFYDAHRCYNDAEAVVDEFLGLLSKLTK
ncbi:MAG: hypothetical protein WCA08_19095 [Desulfoferrobacter sp.]